MPRATRIKPISHFKANMIIARNGEAKAVVQDIVSSKRTQETLALLKILAVANRSIEQGHYRPAKDVFNDLRQRLNARKTSKRRAIRSSSNGRRPWQLPLRTNR